MLLANMAVARRIYHAFPEEALLRLHPAPLERKLHELVDVCRAHGIELEGSRYVASFVALPNNYHSSTTLQRSLAQFAKTQPLEKYLCLQAMCAQPMQVAKYFCTGSVDDAGQFRHYALNVPFYTHFTSPIRYQRLLCSFMTYVQTLCGCCCSSPPRCGD